MEKKDPITKLTRKQKAFADALIDCKNGTEAALAAYNTTDRVTASVIASENLRKESVKVYLAAVEEKAKSVIEKLMEDAKQETVRLAAAKDVLDRNVGKARENKTVNMTIDAPYEPTEEEEKALFAALRLKHGGE